MTSYEKELDTDNKLHNYLKITDILNNVFRPQKTLKKTRIKLYKTGRASVLYNFILVFLRVFCGLNTLFKISVIFK